jgi:hypothetical protein
LHLPSTQEETQNHKKCGGKRNTYKTKILKNVRYGQKYHKTTTNIRNIYGTHTEQIQKQYETKQNKMVIIQTKYEKLTDNIRKNQKNI